MKRLSFPVHRRLQFACAIVQFMFILGILAVDAPAGTRSGSTKQRATAGKDSLVISDSQPQVQAAFIRLLELVGKSGRVAELRISGSETALDSSQIAPGAPPLISFRYFDGKIRHRFGGLDLVLDDASH